ncbi:CDP-glycerol glycerophosphotransferase family protein [Sporosarcina sp. Marseille-Q4063]|uniref:CDP-glycerol glycerophosphotransferase family protein n=1 Tax=Sporosarcina sp. Marseille-Q4063 TaxID=2810514 RepID=UPI001BAEF7E2|nr:CDP-glycerol glycerophosphotransferase family protein [Sporosarcina sp. Marseille-Q4063]QUW21214.1 CDP-glycerol glycerophosphotransferase family protein [Sporosarcina sp. Marseille-Q4063]
MLKEFLITIYLFLTKSIFTITKLFPVQNKYVFVSSFGDNIDYVAREVLRRQQADVVVLRSRKSNYSFDQLDLNEKRIISFDSLNIIQYVKSIYHLATARHVFVDNYFAFLSVMNFKPGVECIQLWHAAGAVKRFGMEDPTFYDRTSSAQKRFKSVYARFDKVVVGSDSMIPVFKKAFNLKDEQFLKTGIPRTDFFYDEVAKSAAINEVYATYPGIESKQVILYAPTFRRDELEGQEIGLEIEKMTTALGPEFMLLIRMHPAVKMNYVDSRLDGIIDVSAYPNVNHLLLVTDYLLSDYSSMPYEFALLNRPQIFFPYDLDDYEKESGFWSSYEDVVPGPIVQSTDEIIELIRNDEFDKKRIQHFSNRWNRYSDGESSKALIGYLKE